MDALLQDLRYGIRTLRKHPAFTAIAAGTLGLGIGATTVIFSFVNAVILRPLPYKDSRKLVVVFSHWGESGETSGPIMPGDVVDWEAQNKCFEAMAAFSSAGYSLTGDGEPERLSAAQVTSRFFETLAATPVVGRTFFAHEGQPGADRVVVISSALWRRRFQSDAAITGKSIRLDGDPFTVIGVMPDGFGFPGDVMRPPGAPHAPRDIDVWTPASLPVGERGNTLISGVIARLKSGVTIDRAQTEMSAIARGIEERLPATNRGLGVKLVALHARVVENVQRLLFIFLAAVACLLLIACTNVANLLLARASSRRKEVALRTALGSSRWRLMRQFLTESVLIGLLGGSIGLLWAVWGIDVVAHFIPPGSVPRLREVVLDEQVLMFTVLVSCLTSVIFGLAPALQAANLDLASGSTRHPTSRALRTPPPNVVTALKDADATQSPASRFLDFCVIAQVMLAFVLVAGAGLLLKSFLRLTSIDPGFKAANILTVSVTLPNAPYATPTQMRAFADAVLERLRFVPRGLHSGVVDWLPFGGPLLWGDFIVDGLARPPRGLAAAKPAVSPGYFDAMGIPLLHGRRFTERDTAEAPGVVIVNDLLARGVYEERQGAAWRTFNADFEGLRTPAPAARGASRTPAPPRRAAAPAIR